MSKDNTKQKNILLIIRYPVGGIKTYIRYVLKKSYFNDFKFTVILPRNEIKSGFAILNSEGVEIEYIGCHDDTRSLFLKILSILHSARFDLIHSHGFTSGVCAVVFSKIYSIQHILTVHDVLLQNQFIGITGIIKKRLLSLLFNQIDLIQSVSYDAENNLREMLPEVQSSRMVTILNGIDINQFNSDDTRNLRSELGLTNQHFIIGFLGRFMSQKGFRYLIDAIALLKAKNDLPMIPIVVAIGDGGFIREEKELIANEKLQDHFIFLPAVSNVGPSMRGMNILTIPSLWEACPLLPMEALVSGVPLIASDCIGLREVIAGSPAFKVNTKDAHNLAQVIRNCMTNSETLEFQDYREVAKKRFDSKNTSIQLLELYDSLTNS